MPIFKKESKAWDPWKRETSLTFLLWENHLLQWFLSAERLSFSLALQRVKKLNGMRLRLNLRSKTSSRTWQASSRVKKIASQLHVWKSLQLSQRQMDSLQNKWKVSQWQSLKWQAAFLRLKAIIMVQFRLMLSARKSLNFRSRSKSSRTTAANEGLCLWMKNKYAEKLMNKNVRGKFTSLTCVW